MEGVCMRNLILAVLAAGLLSGCSWVQFQDGYKMAKIVYQDTKYAVYEVIEEKKSVESDLKETK